MDRLNWFSRLTLVGFVLGSSFTLPALHANALTVTVKCEPPIPGVYTLGWGTSRLVIPKNGTPYITFRGNTAPVTDTICKSGDGIGVVLFRADGTVWAYVQVEN